jgi:hypothetical protein
MEGKPAVSRVFQEAQRFITLTRLAALDAIRQPIVLLLTIAMIVLSALTPMVLLHKFGEDGKLAREGGLAFHFLLGTLVTVYAASSALTREIRSGTVAAVLSKPVSRGMLFLAKFAGVVCVIVGFSVAAATTTLLAERVAERWAVASGGARDLIDWRTAWSLLAAPFAAVALAGLLNYWRKRPFTSTAFWLVVLALLATFVASGWFDRAGALAPFDYRVDWRILPASALMATALVVIAAIAAGLATRLAPAPTLALCGLVLVMGLLWEYLFGRVPESGFALLVGGLVPNWQNFWVSDALVGGGHIPWSYVGRTALYAATYAAGALLIGVASFRYVDV